MILVENFIDGMEQEIREVFYTSIRMCCGKDYSEEQLAAWAPDNYDRTLWSQRIRKIRPFVACLDGKIVGYADLQKDGYIDHFFVHGEYQARGVGAALMSTIFSRSNELDTLYSQVSITAKAFFMRHGFEVLNAQEVQINEVKLKNYLMGYQNKADKN